MLFYSLCITNKTEHFSFKSWYVVWVAKYLKDDVMVIISELCVAVISFIDMQYTRM